MNHILADKEKYLDIDLESFAIYNTLVINPYTKTVDMSLEINTTNSYVLILYTNSEIELNIIGSRRKAFKLYYSDNENKNDDNCDDKIFTVKCSNMYTV